MRSFVFVLCVTCCSVLISSNLSGQQSNRFNDMYELPHRRPQQQTRQRRYTDQRIAALPSRYDSVVNQETAPFPVEQSPNTQAVPTQSVNSWQQNDLNHVAPWSPQHCDSCYSDSRYIPYVTGDIFGVPANQCCDEWKGHCECLQLTNSRRRCDCSNPRRRHWGQSDCASGSCNEWVADRDYYHAGATASRTPVSDYFHTRSR